jgi:uncharacterized protein (TIGR02391 family)
MSATAQPIDLSALKPVFAYTLQAQVVGACPQSPCCRASLGDVACRRRVKPRWAGEGVVSSDSQPTAASTTPDRGIELLGRQREKGDALLRNRPLSEADFNAWENTTREILIACFGGSENVRSFLSAGRRPVMIWGASETEYEESRAESLRVKLKMLDSCVEQLEMRVAAPPVPVKLTPYGITLQSLHTKIVQRCRAPFEAGQYDTAILNAFIAIEEELRTRISADPSDVGVSLVTKAMNPKSPCLVFSNVAAEKEAAHALYRGAIGFLKNPRSHRFVGTADPVHAFEVLAFASLLMRLLDGAKHPS